MTTGGTRTSPRQLARSLATSLNGRAPELSSSGERHVASERRFPARRPPSFGHVEALKHTLLTPIGGLCEPIEDDGWASGGERELRAALRNLPAPPESMLRRVFDLTPAEARLASKLARGDSLEEVAQSLDVKMTTARSQLAAIFAKTGTCRQAQLVAILSRLAHLSNT